MGFPPPPPHPADSIVIFKNIPYAKAPFDAEFRSASVFAPKHRPQGKVPFLFFTHGGAWISNSKSSFAYLGQTLAERGIVTVLSGYRLTNKADPEAGVVYPAHYHDVADGFAWAVQNLSSLLGYAVDGGAILAGHSAGAHLNGMVVMKPGFLSDDLVQQVRHLVGIEGIYDLETLTASFPTYPAWFLDHVFPVREDWPSVSLCRDPLQQTHVPHTIVWSRDDELIDERQGLEFKQTLERLGVAVEYDTSIPGTHDLMVRHPAMLNLLERVVAQYRL
ncbi:Kynurenine formamidase [Kappamyces sp. JEL0680]|nr:Kynurenine formamidase [Kappamyces sp. JEL0680]